MNMRKHRNKSLPAYMTHAYQLAYRLLGLMASHGHVTQVKDSKGKTKFCTVSDEMRDYIEALDNGDGERIKGFNLHYRTEFGI